MIPVLTPAEWKLRYMKALCELGGMPSVLAVTLADEAFVLADEYLSPEDAAAEEMSHWVGP